VCSYRGVISRHHVDAFVAAIAPLRFSFPAKPSGHHDEAFSFNKDFSSTFHVPF
jgi:hypothetical protein